MRPGELASLATMLPSTQVERRESSQTSSRMLYDVWVHKFGSRLEQNGEESSTTSTGRPLGSQSPSIGTILANQQIRVSLKVFLQEIVPRSGHCDLKSALLTLAKLLEPFLRNKCGGTP
jgi:hypothetical protein